MVSSFVAVELKVPILMKRFELKMQARVGAVGRPVSLVSFREAADVLLSNLR